MEEEIKFPIEFTKCPNCGCPDTTCRLAYKQEVVDKEKGPDVFVSSVRLAIPLGDPRSAMLTLPELLEHHDTCARCGLPYCTKAEITREPSGGKGFGFPQGRPGLS